MITLGLLIMLLIVFVAGNWSGYNFGYKAGTLNEIQSHIVQHNHKR